MATSVMQGINIAGIATCVPGTVADNLQDSGNFSDDEVRKVVALAGVKKRPVADESICSSDLCRQAASRLLNELGWDTDTIDAIVLITQTPDYFLPSTSSLLHRDLGLREDCAAFDVGLGCSGYPYGLWLGAMMIATKSAKRVLVLHGETPSRFTYPDDRATVLLFGDAGSATAMEAMESSNHWGFCLHSDGAGYSDLIIPGGGFRNRLVNAERDNFLHMNGGNLFNFTVQKVPALIEDSLNLLGLQAEEVDAYVFHQSNQFIMKHIAKKCGLPKDKVPVILEEFGNCGGPSVPLTITQAVDLSASTENLRIMALGYGVGLSWGSATFELGPRTLFDHSKFERPTGEVSK